RSYKSNFGY
ncbi:hypothetical protein CP8484711_1758B, partial [Chlamydia psittaci 84-8471/1]